MKRNIHAAFPKPKGWKGRGWEKRDWAETEKRNFKDPRSYCGFRVHPGTSHCCVYLKGEDATARRVTVFVLAHGLCGDCKKGVSYGDGEMDHVDGGNGRDRCSCFENLRWLCRDCHVAKHGRYPRLGRIGVTV